MSDISKLRIQYCNYAQETILYCLPAEILTYDLKMMIWNSLNDCMHKEREITKLESKRKEIHKKYDEKQMKDIITQ